MSSDEIAVRVRDLSKHYLLFNRPQDRLKQSIVPRLQRLVGCKPKKYYRDFAALSNVSFDIKRGETVGMIGRNGSGKSTLLQIICGTLRPNGGMVEVNGRIAALLELGAGFNTEFTGRENVYLNGAILGLQHGEIDARFDDIARFADIGDFIDQPVKTYSSGMYVRLAFATAINVDPDILVVDEALSVGDEAFQRKCYARLEEIKERGGTILFVSHGAQTIVQLCDRAMLIDRGEVILEGQPKLVTSQYQRFMNLSGPEAEPVREEIKAMDGWAASRPNNGASRTPTERGGVTVAAACSDPIDDENDSAWLDPKLVSQSRVEYESKGAHIRDVRIVTPNGRQVNVLEMGRSYIFKYNVDFDRRANDVAFGVSLTTLTGLAVAGAGLSQNRKFQIKRLDAGQSVQVEFWFRCVLLPGSYFLTAGVSGVIAAERQYLHRILDAITCRVAPVKDIIATGLIDLGFKPKLKVSPQRVLAECPAE